MNDVVPTLKMVESATLKKLRPLPENGHILVDVGEAVASEDVIARCPRMSKPVVIDVAKELQLNDGRQVTQHLKKAIGQSVQRGEIIARKKGKLGRGGQTCVSPVEGVILSGPTRWGEVLVNPLPREVELLALVPGIVSGVVPSRGVVIETSGAYFHAIVGVGADTSGAIKMMVDTPGEELSQQAIDETCSGCVLVGGTVGVSAIRSAVLADARAIVVGSVSGSTLEWMQSTPQPISIIVVEAFGLPGMSKTMFELLSARDGRSAAIFIPLAGPSTKWRRYPAEVVIPDTSARPHSHKPEFGLGSTVRIVRGDGQGETATVVVLPRGKHMFPSGILAPAVELVTCSDKRRLVARANIELIY